MKRIYYAALAVALTFTACKQDDGLTLTVNGVSPQKKSLEELPEWNRKQYLLLRDTAAKEVIGEVDKIEIRPELNRIYILDAKPRAGVVAAYDMAGHFLSTVGRRGQGPMEYIGVSDFDVDADGNVYLLDSYKGDDNVLLYDTNFRGIKEMPLPFEAGTLCALGRDSLLFGLESWNTGAGAGYKLGWTNREMQLARTDCAYTEFDPNVQIADYVFGKSWDYIVYYQPIDNAVRVFTRDGQLAKVFRFSFGGHEVPKEARTDIQAHWDDYERYVLLKKVLAVTDRYLIGLFWERKKDRLFVLDYQENICYMDEQTDREETGFACGFSGGGLVSALTIEDEAYPDSVNNHIREERMVLEIRMME